MTDVDKEVEEAPQPEPTTAEVDTAPPGAVEVTGAGEAFDAAAAVAELEAAMADADEDPKGSHGAADGYIAILEDEVMQLTALVEAARAALKVQQERAEEAQEQVELAKARMQKESTVVLQRRTRKVLLAFVEVLDDLERALGAARDLDHNPEVVAGIEMVQRSFMTTLLGFKVVKQAAMGERFDPALHDAVSMIPVTDPEQDGRVVAVTVDGYIIDEDLLRPAAVVVGKAG